MAAIISQMAANKRARQKGRKHIIPPEKCVYILPPFDPCFDPLVHNKYMKAMSLKAQLDKAKEIQKANEALKKAEESSDMKNTFIRFVVVSMGISAIIFLMIYLYVMLTHKWDDIYDSL
jgi:hypothetical protein